MNCIALYHVAFEDLGSFATPLRERGYALSYRHAGTDPLTRDEWTGADLVVVLGGPIGVGDSLDYPWLGEELAGLRLRLALGLPTLGVCLGAQLMAAALGGRVERRQAGAEIGWGALRIADSPGVLDALRGLPVLHWHGDNIVLPPEVAALAASPGTPVQAFAAGAHALGLQCHAEFSGDALEAWLTGHAVELRQAGIDLALLRAETVRYAPRLEQAGAALLRHWLDGLHDYTTRRTAMKELNRADAPSATLYHDGCSTCLQIASVLRLTIPDLEVVDLSRETGRIDEAEMMGVTDLPSLFTQGELLPVDPHSTLAELRAGAH